MYVWFLLFLATYDYHSTPTIEFKASFSFLEYMLLFRTVHRDMHEILYEDSSDTELFVVIILTES